jgi:acyl dehydratase
MVFEHPRELLHAAGMDLGTSDWLVVDQDRIDTFAKATGDEQWIHVDPVRASAGPYGACIAHGYLTLALVNLFLPQLLDVRGASAGLNLGCDRARFPEPVRVGSRLRASARLASAEPRAGGVQVVVHVEMHVDGVERPAAVVDAVCRYLASDL